MHRTFPALAILLMLATSSARAQGLPTEPVSLGEGRLVVGAEVAATVASADPGFFNYTDYQYSALRNVRVGITAEVRVSQRFQILGELRMDQGDLLQPFALFARFRPWPVRRFDIQIGRIPPTFGAFAGGTYGAANMLIGSPLAYQYLTSLRPDALPAAAEDLVRMRGRGWLSNFPVGNLAPDRGLPLINSVRRDTGVQVHGVYGILEWTGAVTTGSLSNPRVNDDNDGRQVAGRAVIRPAAAVAIGVSSSHGAYVSRRVESALGAGHDVEDGTQHAFGIDGEYSSGRFVGRSEAIWSQWRLPVSFDGRDAPPLEAMSILAEARYRILPGVHAAARAERLGFSDVRTATTVQTWDAPVRRFELGAGYSIVRNVIVKASWQRNLREGGRVRRDTLGALQVVYWF